MGRQFSFRVLRSCFNFAFWGKGGLEASWWTGENKSCLQNKSSRFWQKCCWWRLQSFMPKTTSWWLLLCRLSACGVTLAKIFIFFLESGPYVYVQRASDLRSLLNRQRVPELKRCETAFKATAFVPAPLRNTVCFARQCSAPGVFVCYLRGLHLTLTFLWTVLLFHAVGRPQTK